MHEAWVVSANSSLATIFEADSPTGALHEVTHLEHPEARLKDQQLTSDRPGRTFDSLGSARHAKSSRVNPRQTEDIRFAQRVAEKLEQGRREGSFDRLVVVVAPEFLGHLRDKMSAPLRSSVTVELDKDYTALRPEEVRAHLPERI